MVRQAPPIFEMLRERRILVRYFNHPADNALRITIGTDGECDALIEALKEIVSRTV